MNQDDKRFENEFGAVLRDLDQVRETCPDNSVLMAWQAGELDGEQSARLGRHVAACAECSAIVAKLGAEPAPVDDIAWARAKRSLDQRQWPWQHWRGLNPSRLGLIAAGIAVLAVALIWLQPSPQPEISPTTRGSAPLTVLAPTGPVADLEFRWQALPIHHAYVIEIARGEQEIASIETWRPPYRPDPELLAKLESGTVYRWRVGAVDGAGRRLDESEWAEFQLRD